MRSSSNLVREDSGLVQAWSPFNFGEPAYDPQPEPAAESALEPLVGAQAFAPAAANPDRAQGRTWTPPEVVPFRRAQAGSAGRPGARSLAAGPTLEEVRATLVQETMAQAGQILASAQQQAADVVRQAEQHAAQIIQEAQEQGLQAAREQTGAMVETMHEMVRQVRAWQDDLTASSQGFVFHLVQEVGRALFCDGLTLPSEMLQETYNRVLQNARTLGDLRVYVNPEDALNLGPYWREYQQSVSGQQIDIIPSESIQRGGCFVDGQLGTVDARVETQYKALMDALAASMEVEGGQR